MAEYRALILLSLWSQYVFQQVYSSFDRLRSVATADYEFVFRLIGESCL